MASEIKTDSIFKSTLLDSSGQKIIIVDSSLGHELIWNLVNNQDDVLVVTPFDSPKVDQNQYHFRFNFSRGALTNTPVMEGWNVFPVRDGRNGITDLYIALSGKELSIAPSHTQKTILTYTRAIQQDSNNSQITVHVTTGDRVALGGDKIPNKDVGPFDLTLVQENAPVLTVPPIAVDFVGRRTVLNDGLTSNDFTFAITNMMQSNLTLKPAGGQSPTSFTVWFDAVLNDAVGGFPEALARIQDLSSKDFSVGKPNDDWHVQNPVTALKDAVVNPRWHITVLKPVELAPQSPVLFKCKGLKTNLDPGVTRMYLQFDNLAGFRPGVLIAELEKTPQLYGPTRGKGLYLSAGVSQGKTPPPVNYDAGLFIHQFGTGAAAIFEASTQDANGGTLILGSGNPDDPSLRFGCQPKYAWIQSHAGKPLSLNPIPRNVGIGVGEPGSTLSVNGGVAIGSGYSQSTTQIGQNNLAVEGRVGVHQTTPGSSLSVDGGVAIGNSYSKSDTTIGANNLAVEGKVGIKTTTPAATLQVGETRKVGGMFGEPATVGILQDSADKVGLSIQRLNDNAVVQFVVYDQDGKNSKSNFIQSEKGTGDILIGSETGKQTRVKTEGKLQAPGVGVISGSEAKTKNVLELGVGYKDKQIDAGKLGYRTFSDGLDIVGAGEKAADRQVNVWSHLALMTGGNKDIKNVLEFGYDYPNKQKDAGKIAYKVFSEGLDIVGATSNLNNRQVHLWDEVYVHGNFWMVSNGFWCFLQPNNPVNRDSWDWAKFNYSDRRLKTSVARIETPLDKVRKLSGSTFHWSEEALTHFTKEIDTLQPADSKLTEEQVKALRETERERQRKILQQPQVGVIAQEVEAVLPQAVTAAEDGYKTVDYRHLIALLIEAVKELDQEVKQLKTQLAKA